MIYGWDSTKASANPRKHEVSFAEAALVFIDPLAWAFEDPDHSDEENREITIGISSKGRAVLVSHCWLGDQIRIISAGKATPREKKQYAQKSGK